MKKRNGLNRALQPISKRELKTLPTGSLLARRKRLLWCEKSPEQSDLSVEEVASVAHIILFKTDSAWQNAYRDVKEALAAREHVTNKP